MKKSSKTTKKTATKEKEFLKKKKGNKASIFSELDEATKRSYETRDSFGESSDYFKKGLKLKKWFTKDGEHLIDIIPFIAGSNNPNTAEGKPAYVLDVWVHRNFGPSNASYICPQKNFKQPCPICQKQRDMRKEGGYTEDEIKELNAKRRTVYNILCYDSQEEINKGVQIFETAHFFMEKHLAELAKKPKGGGFIPFAHPETGKSISWTIEKKGKYGEWIGHKFVDREDEEITDDILDAAYILDEIIHIPTTKELEKAVKEFDANSDHDEEEEEIDETEEELDEDEDEIDEDDEEEEEEEEEERPKKRKKLEPKKPAPSSKKKKKVVEEEDEEEDEDEDEDDEDDDDEDDFDDFVDDEDEEEEEKPKKKSKSTSHAKKKKVRR